MYTITSAIYANPDHSSAVITTTEAGAVAISEADTPDEWAALVASGVAIAAFGASLDDRRAARLAAIAAAAETRLVAGAPMADGLHIALDDGSRADLTAMAATATAAVSGAVVWPESYGRGWISLENVRIPLDTPAAGLTLAAAVGDWYARVIQHRRDLKDAALAAGDVAALDAIDITAGWPD